MSDATTAPRDVGLVETAKLMRRHLALAFPGIKFSVRTSRFSGGSSADVSWTDGPTERQVREVTECFAYGGFDGSIDMGYYRGAWYCAEHGASFRRTSGTEGSMGYVPAADGGPCCLGAEPVSFGARFVGQRRRLSPEFEQLIKDDIECVTGEEFDHGRSYAAVVLSHGDDAGRLVECRGSREYGSTLFHQLAGTTAVTAEREIQRTT